MDSGKWKLLELERLYGNRRLRSEVSMQGLPALLLCWEGLYTIIRNMTRKTFLSRLQRPVHPVLSALAIAFVTAIGALLILYALQHSSSPSRQPKTAYSIPSASPTLPSPEPPLTLPPTLAPGQKAIYAYHILATAHTNNGNTSYDANGKAILEPHQQQGYNVITLDGSLSGRTFELPIGTFIFLHFPTGEHTVSTNPKGVVEYPGGRYNLPNGDIGIYKVVSQGTATITVSIVEH